MVKLTKQEARVMAELASDGASNAVIAKRLKLALPTIKIYMRAILRKLGARTRAQAIIIWREKGGR